MPAVESGFRLCIFQGFSELSVIGGSHVWNLVLIALLSTAEVKYSERKPKRGECFRGVMIRL